MIENPNTTEVFVVKSQPHSTSLPAPSTCLPTSVAEATNVMFLVHSPRNILCVYECICVRSHTHTHTHTLPFQMHHHML